MPKLIAQMLGTNGHFQFTIVGLTPGRTNVVQASSDLWTSLSTNVPTVTSLPVDTRLVQIGEDRMGGRGSR